MTDLVAIKSFASRSEADLAKSFLEANGIHSTISADDAGGMYPFMTEKIQIFVQQKDKQKAKTVLKKNI